MRFTVEKWLLEFYDQLQRESRAEQSNPVSIDTRIFEEFVWIWDFIWRAALVL